MCVAGASAAPPALCYARFWSPCGYAPRSSRTAYAAYAAYAACAVCYARMAWCGVVCLRGVCCVRVVWYAVACLRGVCCVRALRGACDAWCVAAAWCAVL